MSVQRLIHAAPPLLRRRAMDCESAEELFRLAESCHYPVSMAEAEAVFLHLNPPLGTLDLDAMALVAGGKGGGGSKKHGCEHPVYDLIKIYTEGGITKFDMKCANCKFQKTVYN